MKDPGLFLKGSLNAWNTPAFADALKAEIEPLGASRLPLQQALSQASYALDEDLNANLITTSEDADFLYVKLGLFYTGLIAGCSCADDPTPLSKTTEYCVVRLDIDKHSARTTVHLLAE